MVRSARSSGERVWCVLEPGGSTQLGGATEQDRSGERVERQREEEALGEARAESLELLELLRRLDAFGDGVERHAAADRDDALHDLTTVGRVAEAMDERAVDLQGRDGESPQLADRAEAGAEVIDADLDVALTQCLQQTAGHVDVAHHDRFRQVEAEV